MTSRVIHVRVTFSRPTALSGVDGPLPPGTYEVEHHEEQIEGLSFVAYRRVATTITLSLGALGDRQRQIVTIDADDLARAHKADQEFAS